MRNATAIAHDLGMSMRAKLAGFTATLRDNGFVIGLAETRDALTVMSGESATRVAGFGRRCDRSFAAAGRIGPRSTRFSMPSG